MHGAWCVGLTAGDTFDVCVQLNVGDAIHGILNKGVIVAGNSRIKQTSLELLLLLMQNLPCLDMAGYLITPVLVLLRPSFASATCEHQNQPCLAGP
jgi:hypothetical protein